jgi:hypothetical protein
MNRIMIALVVASMALLMGMSVASAQSAPYGAAGCGLGSVVFGNQEGFVQVFAATTNGTFYSQTFGITSGTSNCVQTGLVKADKEQEMFMEANLNHIQRDMASGGGEYLDSFGQLLGCDASMQSSLDQFAQDHYASIFPTEETSSTQALYIFKAQISMEEDFVRACTRI